MPSTITHAYIGLDTLKRLDKKPKEIINKRIDNYQIYCQNMDVLYFYHIFLLKENSIQKVGHDFHTKNVFNYFKTMIDDNKENKDLELFTFIAGLITHYQADKIIHPYINFLAKNKNRIKMINKHFEIETYLDNYFTNKYQEKNYQSIKNYLFLYNYKENEIVKKEIDKIFKIYFKCENMGYLYTKSVKEMAFVYKYLRHDKYGIKKKIYQLIDLNPFNIRRTTYLSYHFSLNNNDYYLNTKKNSWYNYYNPSFTSNKSLLELYEEVIDCSSNIINELYKYIFEEKKLDLKKLIGNYSYSTGNSLD